MGYRLCSEVVVRVCLNVWNMVSYRLCCVLSGVLIEEGKKNVDRVY